MLELKKNLFSLEFNKTAMFNCKIVLKTISYIIKILIHEDLVWIDK